MRIIDAHVSLGEGAHLRLSADELLRQMDEAGVACAIACPVDRCLAVDNAEGNDVIAAAVRAHADRLAGMACANPWFGDRAVEDLRRALGEGLAGLMIHSVYQGFRLDDPIVHPLLEVAAEHGVPVYAHTGTAGLAEPFHVAELARRFPSVNFLMGHAGASDYYTDAVAALEFADNVWLESSRNGPANYMLFSVRECLGRLVFGSGAPEYIPAVEIEVIRDTVEDERMRAAIVSGTIASVFKGRLPV